jgi:hypothetical protein
MVLNCLLNETAMVFVGQAYSEPDRFAYSVVIPAEAEIKLL